VGKIILVTKNARRENDCFIEDDGCTPHPLHNGIGMYPSGCSTSMPGLRYGLVLCGGSLSRHKFLRRWCGPLRLWSPEDGYCAEATHAIPEIVCPGARAVRQADSDRAQRLRFLEI